MSEVVPFPNGMIAKLVKAGYLQTEQRHDGDAITSAIANMKQGSKKKWQHDKSALMTSIMKGRRRKTNSSRSYAKITSARTSSRSYANGAMARGKTRRPADLEATVIGWRGPKRNQR